MGLVHFLACINTMPTHPDSFPLITPVNSLPKLSGWFFDRLVSMVAPQSNFKEPTCYLSCYL